MNAERFRHERWVYAIEPTIHRLPERRIWAKFAAGDFTDQPVGDACILRNQIHVGKPRAYADLIGLV